MANQIHVEYKRGRLEIKNLTKMRHINQIKNLPISELTDEEITKAAMYRLNTKALMLVYDDGGQWNFISRYKKGGGVLINRLKLAWEEKFGKFKKMEEE